MVAVDLPAGAEVTFPASLYAVFHQTIWVTAGQLTLVEGDATHVLDSWRLPGARTAGAARLSQRKRCVVRLPGCRKPAAVTRDELSTTRP